MNLRLVSLFITDTLIRLLLNLNSCGNVNFLMTDITSWL